MTAFFITSMIFAGVLSAALVRRDSGTETWFGVYSSLSLLPWLSVAGVMVSSFEVDASTLPTVPTAVGLPIGRV